MVPPEKRTRRNTNQQIITTLQWKPANYGSKKVLEQCSHCAARNAEFLLDEATRGPKRVFYVVIRRSLIQARY